MIGVMLVTAVVDSLLLLAAGLLMILLGLLRRRGMGYEK